MEQNESHLISIENRKRLTATQIEAVEAFSPTQLVLSYAGGRIIVAGSDMKITSFSKSNGGFSASGTFTSVKYAQKGMGLKQKLFR
ncbi:MAG: sporulation protein YabP [Clostridia bacterium]|nr:sporulation protein YabP [Clostridia bacterium]